MNTKDKLDILRDEAKQIIKYHNYLMEKGLNINSKVYRDNIVKMYDLSVKLSKL